MASMKNRRQTIGRSPIIAERVRRIEGGFCFVPHRFLHQGFFASLNQEELLLYFFLVLAGDRNGISFYCHDKICSLLFLRNDEYLFARNCLIEKDLIAFDGRRFQVLSLPEKPRHRPAHPLCTTEEFEMHDRATIREIIRQQFDKKSIEDNQE